jgi:hypothetical protein
MTPHQRVNVLQAARDARARAPRDYATYDAISLAGETRNYWWTGGMSNHDCEVALKLIRLNLTRTPLLSR